MSSRPRKKVSAFFNTVLHIVDTKPLKETEHAVSSIGHRWETIRHNNKFMEPECVVTHGARMCDPEGVCVGGVSTICRLNAVGRLPGQ